MPTIAAAFPFIEVKIDTSALTPIAQRSPGVIAVVGKAPDKLIATQKPIDAGGVEVVDPLLDELIAKVTQEIAINTPVRIDTPDDVKLFTERTITFKKDNAGVWVVDKTIVDKETDLSRSLSLAMLQDPKPSKIYGVRVKADDYTVALSSLEAADDVTFVSLANEVRITPLAALKNHVEVMSAAGQKRIGVAMVDPATAKSNTYVNDVKTTVASLKSDFSRMVVIAARGATGDSATAAMSAIAGYDPQISMVLKKARGFKMPVESQYSPSEIKGLSEEGIIPIIDPALIVGESLHFAEGRCFTTDASLLYIDIVRVLDDIDFRLKAGLIGAVGDARITKSGMTMLKTRVEGILGPLQRSNVIVDFNIDIPVLNILSLPESAWNATDRSIVETARANRTVDLFVSVTYGPAVHRLKVSLAPKF